MSEPLTTRRFSILTWKGPGQAVTVTEALHAYTTLGAHAGGEEHIKGSRGVGKLADIAVLDRDVFSVPEDDILETQTDLTMVGGAVKYRRD